LNYASAGAGSFTHLGMALFLVMTGTNIVHVPYKGGAPAAIATMTGETQLAMSSVGASIPAMRQGKLRALAVSGAKRSAALPDIPSVAEAGVAGYEASSWYGMLVPAKTPAAVVQRLGELSVKALADAQLKERLLAQGIEGATGGVEEFGNYLNVEIAKWAKVISAAAIPPQ
jgi:tripartite-type tricarboxylate transporter receptor subunit TctC